MESRKFRALKEIARANQKRKWSRNDNFWPEEGVGPCRVYRSQSEPKGVHLRLFVDVVLAGVAQATLEAPSLFCKGPDQAFPCGKRLRLAAEDGVFKGKGGVDPLPPSGFEGIHDLGKNESVQRVEMHQQSVANVAADDVESELAVERSAIQEVSDQVIAIGGVGGIGLLGKPIDEALADVPVGSVDGDMADAIAAFLEQGAKTIALVGGVAFLQEGIAEKRRPVVIGSDHLFVSEEIDRE